MTMYYSALTFTQLRGLLTERAVVGRSKATTKEKAIALLEECDRALVQKQLSKFPLSADPAPAVNDADFAPVAESEPKFRDEHSNNGVAAVPQDAKNGALEITSDTLGRVNGFRLDAGQVDRLLNALFNQQIRRVRGEDCAFLSTPKDLASPVDLAIAAYLSRVGFNFIGRVNLTSQYTNLDSQVHAVVSAPLMDTIYGWEIHTSGISYGKPSSPWRFIWAPAGLFAEIGAGIVADIYQIASIKIRAKMNQKYFGPLPVEDIAQLRKESLPDWLCTSDGHWHVRQTPEHFDIFRWWWSHSGGGRWKLDYCKVSREASGYHCACNSEHCKHLEIIEKFQQKMQQKERQKQYEALQKQRQKSLTSVNEERNQLIESLRKNHFKLASDIGFALFRQPFWGLSLNQIKQINQEILSQVKQP